MRWPAALSSQEAQDPWQSQKGIVADDHHRAPGQALQMVPFRRW
jgi:hypothetical protein